MEEETGRNIRVGIVVSLGTALLIFALYVIGDKQNLFGSTFRISAEFYNVNGLTAGNNVRLSGIDVGTVENVEIVNDSLVKVVMTIEESARKFIKKNSLASVGSDGLMGNKLVNITSAKGASATIEEGDVLQTLRPFETDETLRTLNLTNENVKFITGDLKSIAQKIDNSDFLWSVLADTGVADNVKDAIVNFRLTSNRSAMITGDLNSIMKDVKAGKGSLGTLLTDTAFSGQLKQTIVILKALSDSMAYVSGNLKIITDKMKNGEGTIGALLMDTLLVHTLNKSMENIKTGSEGFSENMEALKHNFLLRGYYQKKGKQKNN